MILRLIYVMDPLCSWCWGFTPALEALMKQAEPKGVALHVVAGGLRRERKKLGIDGRDRLLDDWQIVQDATGQSFDLQGLPSDFVYDNEPACRAVVTARYLAPDKVWSLVMQMQQAFHCKGVDVTRPAQLVKLAGKAGLDPELFAEHFDSPAMHEATLADFNWVENLGIAGFPTLLAERDSQLALLASGYQSLDQLEPLLNRWLENSA